MHAAPSVTYPVGRSAFAGWIGAGLALLGLAASALWSLQAAQFEWRQVAAFGCALACGAFSLATWLRSPRGKLRWDGAAWQWEEDGRGAAGQVQLALDLQATLLLRWNGDEGGVRWLWLERKANSADWDALRRAVYSRAEPHKPVPPTGQPPAAEQ